MATTFLVIFGEISPGCSRTGAQDAGRPTIYGADDASLYAVNPMLPALGLLFSGSSACSSFFRKWGHRWLLPAAFVLAISLNSKPHRPARRHDTVPGRHRLRRLLSRSAFLKVLSATGLLLLPLLLMLRQANQTGAGRALSLSRHVYLHITCYIRA